MRNGELEFAPPTLEHVFDFKGFLGYSARFAGCCEALLLLQGVLAFFTSFCVAPLCTLPFFTMSPPGRQRPSSSPCISLHQRRSPNTTILLLSSSSSSSSFSSSFSRSSSSFHILAPSNFSSAPCLQYLFTNRCFHPEISHPNVMCGRETSTSTVDV